MYRTIGTEIWTDPKFRGLPAPGKLMFIYLFTNPHAHVGGIYYLPDNSITHETGLKQEAVDTLWDTLSSAGLSWRDKKTEIVWVINMLKRQGRGEKILRSVAAHLKTLHNCPFILDFLQKYPSVKQYYKHRVSKGYPKLDKSGIQEQEYINSPNGELSEGKAAGPDKANQPEKRKQERSGLHHELFAVFGSAWKAKYGAEYKFAKGKDGEHFKWLRTAVAENRNEALRVVQAYFADDDPWLVKKRHPLGLLISNFNKYQANEPRPSAISDEAPLTVKT